MISGDTGPSSGFESPPETSRDSWRALAGRNDRGEVRTLVLWDGA